MTTMMETEAQTALSTKPAYKKSAGMNSNGRGALVDDLVLRVPGPAPTSVEEIIESLPVSSPTLGEFAKAFCKAQAGMANVTKDAKNPFFNSSYANFSSVVDEVRVPLTSNGLCWLQPTHWIGGHQILETRLLHESGEWMASYYPIEPVKKDPQARGSAMTYARRYSLLSIAGLATDDDDDGNLASHTEPPKRSQGPKLPPRNTAPNSAEPVNATPSTLRADPKRSESIQQLLDSVVAGVAVARTHDELDAVGSRIRSVQLSTDDRETMIEIFSEKRKTLPGVRKPAEARA